MLNSSKQDSFLLELLASAENYQLVHAVLSLVSVIASTLKGVLYLMSNGKEVLCHLIKLMR